jgi:DNA-binding NarL/FixJ family response regulator
VGPPLADPTAVRSLVRVVVADDDASLRLLLRLTLQQDTRLVVVGEAADGMQAIALVEDHDPDLLLLDLSMPLMDGLEVLQALGRRPRPVVAVLTGFDDRELEAQVLRAGAAVFLTKGAVFDELSDRLLALVAS